MIDGHMLFDLDDEVIKDEQEIASSQIINDNQRNTIS